MAAEGEKETACYDKDLEFIDVSNYLDDINNDVDTAEYFSEDLAYFFRDQDTGDHDERMDIDETKGTGEETKQLLQLNKKYQQILRDQLVVFEERQKATKDSLRWLRSLVAQINRKSRLRVAKKPESAIETLKPELDPLVVQIDHLLQDYTKAFQQQPSKWTDLEKTSLARGVRHFNQTIYLDRILRDHDDPTNFIKIGNTPEEAYRNAVNMVQGMSQKDLETNLEGLDWSKISVAFVISKDPKECRIQWTTNQHPLINTSFFSTEEVDRLFKIANKLGLCGRWVEIAEELDTNRTAWQCLSAYRKRSLCIANANTPLTVLGRKWTDEEDKVLLEAIQSSSSQDWWIVAAETLKDRTPSQVLHRWHKALDPSKKIGRWSPKEDAWLLTAIKRYGNSNWSFVKEFVPNRTDVQCRERYMNVLNPQLSHDRFTDDEDRILRDAVQSFGVGKWSLVAAQLSNRTDNQCRRRWLSIRKDSGGGVEPLSDSRAKKRGRSPAGKGG